MGANGKPTMSKASGKWQHATQSRHERGYGSAWVKLRNWIMKHDGYLCQPCKRVGRVTPATEVDHIIPKSQGGEDDADNLEAICTDCHKDKTACEATLGKGGTPRQRTRFDAEGRVIWPE